MFTSFEIKNFRSLNELKIDSLGRVNLIAGPNGVGKTTLLEAIFLSGAIYGPSVIVDIMGLRGIKKVKIDVRPGGEAPWDSLFRNFDASQQIELEGRLPDGQAKSLKIRQLNGASDFRKASKVNQIVRIQVQGNELGAIKVLELKFRENKKNLVSYMILSSQGVRIEPLAIAAADTFPMKYVSDLLFSDFKEIAAIYGKLEAAQQTEMILRFLTIIEPRLTKLAMIFLGGEIPMLHGDIGLDHLVPLAYMGGGLVRAANLAIDLASVRDGILLVDEIENGIYHSNLVKVWQAIGEVARANNTQVFTTTHSYECIAAAHKAFSESKTYDFRLHRIDRVGDQIHAATYDQETMGAALEMGMEVR